MITVTTTSPDETRALAARIAAVVEPGDVLLLAGDLGAGKTTFTQGFGRALGVEDQITSPTFTLMHEYQGRLRLLHIDVYRLDSLQEVVDLGIEELLDDDGVALVEWGDVAAPALPAEHLAVRIEYGGDDDEARTFTLTPAGPAWAARADALRSAAASWGSL